MPPSPPTYEGRRPAAMGGMYRSKRGVSQAAGNRSGLDELYARNAGLSSAEATQAATDVMSRGFNVNSRGEAVPSDFFARQRMQRAPGPTMRERFGTATATAGTPAPVVATGRVGVGGAGALPQIAMERPVMQLDETVIESHPQGMPPTMSDVLSERVDTIGPAGAPTRISSKYGTATRQDFALSPSERLKAEAGKSVRPASMPSATVNEGAMTRFNSIPLQKYLRQRRAAQRERGIA